MSNLLTTLIIDPVVRQARRFSSVQDGAEAALSRPEGCHASEHGGPPDSVLEETSDGDTADDTADDTAGDTASDVEQQGLDAAAAGRAALLPANDGKGRMRSRIHDIQRRYGSDDDKARRLHDLMTEAYRASRYRAGGPAALPAAIALAPTVASAPAYRLTAADRTPHYRPSSVKEAAGARAARSLPFGCVHYQRNVKLQCYDCGAWYPCRHCHNEREDHALDRRLTQNMLCMFCGTAQPAKQHCNGCGACAAVYYCDVCKLWDDDVAKKIYHCDDCGICRRGEGLGKDFVHCKRCNVCLSIGVSDSHRCIERATDCDCPICGEYLFTSSTSVAALPCGHYMHRTCYDQYMLRAYRCPLCSKSAVNMELMWRGLDLQTERQTMPAAFADTRAIVFCNDCCAKSSTQYHWVGHKCALCGSYNTNDLHIVGYPGSAEPDSPARALSPTNGPDRPPVSGSPGAGSYFRSADDPRPTSSASADEAIVFSPYDMLHRMSRSLSPIRTYLLGPNVPPHLARLALFGSDGDDDGAELGGAGVDFWGQNRSSDSSSSDDDDNDDDDDDDDADDGDDEDDGLDDADDEANGIELLGHM